MTPHQKKYGLPPLLRMSLLALLLVGILLLIAAANRMGGEVPYTGGTVPDILHDLGIAFIVSSVVAGLFEIYRSHSHTVDGMSGVIDAIFGEQISPEVWMELKELIAHKQVIRRRARIRIQFELTDKIPENQAILHVEYDYELHALTRKATKVAVQHELDYHLSNEELGLPKFRAVAVQGPAAKSRSFDEANMNKIASNGGIGFDVEVGPRDESTTTIRTIRSELVHIPGAYNVYTPEFMKELSISVADCPPGFEIEVLVRPQGKGQSLTRIGSTWACSHLLLPGQGIEIKFKRTTSVPVAPADGINASQAEPKVLTSVASA